MSHTFIYTHPETLEQATAYSLDDAEAQLGKFLLSRLQLRAIVSDSSKDFYKLVTEMTEGKHGDENIRKGNLHLEAESLLESAEEYFAFFTEQGE